MKVFSAYCFFTMMLLGSFRLTAQDLPRMCGGSMVRYATIIEPNCHGIWEISGGTVISDYNDSIDVVWDNKEGIHIIKVTVESPLGCLSATQYGYVMVSKVEKLFTDKILQTCQGDSLMVQPDLAPTSIVWDNGSTDPFIYISTTGYHKAEAILSNGCTVRDSVILDVYPRPIFSLGRDTSLCNDQWLILDPGINAVSYQWSTGEMNSSITVGANSGLVWASVTDEFGCAFTDTIVIRPCQPSSLTIKIPNTFTPNNDNDNDTWRIELLDNYPNAGVFIYNRWGQTVYKTENQYPSTGWDGTSNGKLLPMSTYYYVIDLKNGTAPLVGSVNLIR